MILCSRSSHYLYENQFQWLHYVKNNLAQLKWPHVQPQIRNFSCIILQNFSHCRAWSNRVVPYFQLCQRYETLIYWSTVALMITDLLRSCFLLSFFPFSINAQPEYRVKWQSCRHILSCSVIVYIICTIIKL